MTLKLIDPSNMFILKTMTTTGGDIRSGWKYHHMRCRDAEKERPELKELASFDVEEPEHSGFRYFKTIWTPLSNIIHTDDMGKDDE